MRDVQASLLPNETVQYQYTYPLWLKIMAGAAIVVFGFALYNDIRTAQSCIMLVDMALVIYAAYWLLTMLRDSALYVVTDMRVMRLGSEPQTDQAIDYTQVGEVRSWKEFISGNGYVKVNAVGGQSIRIPMVGIGRTRTEWLAKLVGDYRQGAQGPEKAPALPGEEEPAGGAAGEK